MPTMIDRVVAVSGVDWFCDFHSVIFRPDAVETLPHSWAHDVSQSAQAKTTQTRHYDVVTM
ncbi:hypothetical protein Sjap_007964 [Stephania japonica]|uniref:Uncharacterized protein n=1 Tax=Stephania japonica TaxID=461633 RepID=A0AAP0JQU7_9MAGN